MARKANIGAAVATAPFIALLGWLSIASAVAAFQTLPYDAAFDNARISQPVAAVDARAAASANEQAAAFFDAPRYRMQAARLLLALPPAERIRIAPRIEALDRASLSAAPMSPYGWTLLAFLRLDRQDVPGAIRAWNMSLLAGRYVPDIMRSRLLLGIQLMPFDREVASSVADQIRVIAAVDPNGLAALARESGNEPLVRFALGSGKESAAFERATAAIVAGARSRLAAPSAKQ